MRDIWRNCSGQMLIEVVVAVGIIALVFVGVSDLMTRSLRVVTYQKQKDVADTLVQKIQNDYKAMRDEDPVNFFNSIESKTVPCGTGTTYLCTVKTVKSGGIVTLTVKAEWADGGTQFSTSSVQSLTNIAK